MSCPNAPVITDPQLDPAPGSPPLHPVSTTCHYVTPHVEVLLNGDGRVQMPLNDGSVVTLNLHGQVVDYDPDCGRASPLRQLRGEQHQRRYRHGGAHL